MKKCFVCLEEKPLDDFYKHSKSRQHIGDGHVNKCKQCTCLAQKDPEKVDRANYLRRVRGKTENQKEANRKWEKQYYKTEAGKKKAKQRRNKYRSKPEKQKLIKQTVFLYRQTDAFKKSVLKHRQKYPEKRIAQSRVSAAIKSGKLIRPDSCVICTKECIPEGHHPDYSKPLEVIWVCKQCHADYHWK